MPLFTKFVEIGRIAYINYGPDRGKICTILDVVDQNRVLVDGPAPITGVSRQAIKLAYLTITSIKIDIHRGPRLKALTKAFNDAKVLEKWNATATAKKNAQLAQKASTTDFDRFKARVQNKKVRFLAKKNLSALQKKQKK